MSAAANTRECFTEFIGHEVVGVLFNALPLARHVLAAGNKTLVFDDGRGLTFSPLGSFWIDSADEVRRAVRTYERRLKDTQSEITGILALAGALGMEERS